MDILEKTKLASAKILDEITYRTTLSQKFIKRHVNLVVKSEDIDPDDNISFYALKNLVRSLATLDLRKIRNHELKNKRRRFIISLVSSEINSRLYGD